MKTSPVVFIQRALNKKKKKKRKKCDKTSKPEKSRSLCAGFYLLALRMLDRLWKMDTSVLNKHIMHVD